MRCRKKPATSVAETLKRLSPAVYRHTGTIYYWDMGTERSIDDGIATPTNLSEAGRLHGWGWRIGHVGVIGAPDVSEAWCCFYIGRDVLAVCLRVHRCTRSTVEHVAVEWRAWHTEQKPRSEQKQRVQPEQQWSSSCSSVQLNV